jgi:two-component system NtrC family sensor kinase
MRTMQDQLMQAEKMSAIGQLISGVAHELSNPLSGVIGFAQLLQSSDLDPKIQKSLDRIYNESIRCQKIVQNLLSFARRHKPEKTSQSLNQVIDSVLDLRGYHLQVDDVVIERRYDADLPTTMLDFHQLQQVFMNVVNNSHQAMMSVTERPRRLVVSTEHEGSKVRARFTDTGAGIPKERLGKIFQPFFTTKEQGKGTGLGLSLSLAIVKNHQGSMSAQSTLGEGTTVTVDLPLIEDLTETAGEPVKREETGARTRLQVLVVDDEPVLTDLLVDFLESVGHSVDHASDGREALGMAKANTYEIILSDLKMPGLDGQGLYEQLCQVKPEMRHRFIFSTGDLANPRVQTFFQTSGCHYVCKPFKLESVLEVIDQVGRVRQAA